MTEKCKVQEQDGVESYTTESDRERNGEDQVESRLILREDLHYTSKKLFYLSMSARVSLKGWECREVVSQALSVRLSDLVHRNGDCPVCPLPVLPYLPPAGSHRGVVEGGGRKVSGAARAEEQRVEMRRGTSSERCSALIGHSPLLRSQLGPPCLQNYSESVSIT